MSLPLSSVVSCKFASLIGFAASGDEVLLEETFGFAQPVISEDHRFRLVDGIADEAAFMESVECAPIEALPSAVVIMHGKIEEREDGVVNRSCVDVHGVHPDIVQTRAQNRSRLARISSADLFQANGRGFAL